MGKLFSDWFYAVYLALSVVLMAWTIILKVLPTSAN